MKVHFKEFMGDLTESAYKQVQAFANKIRPERLITIMAGHQQGRIMVWYWATDEEHQALKESAADD
jgi:hypothetical protein